MLSMGSLFVRAFAKYIIVVNFGTLNLLVMVKCIKIGIDMSNVRVLYLK